MLPTKPGHLSIARGAQRFRVERWGDLAYFSGRLSKNCSSQKAGDSYAMDIRNLELPDIQALMQRVGATVSSITAWWDENGLSYDRSLVAAVTANNGLPATARLIGWSEVKYMYQ